MWSAYETHLRHDIHSRSHQLIEQLHGGLHPRSLSTLAGAVQLVNQTEPPGKTLFMALFRHQAQRLAP